MHKYFLLVLDDLDGRAGCRTRDAVSCPVTSVEHTLWFSLETEIGLSARAIADRGNKWVMQTMIYVFSNIYRNILRQRKRASFRFVLFISQFRNHNFFHQNANIFLCVYVCVHKVTGYFLSLLVFDEYVNVSKVILHKVNANVFII